MPCLRTVGLGLCALALISARTARLDAQGTTATIRGHVSDTQGLAVPGVTNTNRVDGYANCCAAFTVTISVRLPEPFEFDTVTTYGPYGAAAVGVPVMRPSAVPSERPAGSAGATVNVNGGVPVTAGTFGAMAVPTR